MVDLVGMFSSVAIAVLAYVRSRVPGGFYDEGVYGFTPATHRRYAGASAAFVPAFALARAYRNDSVSYLLATAFTIFALFYLTSFLRGFSERDD